MGALATTTPSKDGEIVVTHSNNYLLIAAAFWMFAILSILAQFVARPITSLEDLSLGLACAAVLFAGGVGSLFSRYRWCLRLEGDQLFHTPTLGRQKTFLLTDIEFKITDTKFNDLSKRMQRELGMSGPQATIEASYQGKVQFSIAHTDKGFLQFYKRLKHKNIKLSGA